MTLTDEPQPKTPSPTSVPFAVLHVLTFTTGLIAALWLLAK